MTEQVKLSIFYPHPPEKVWQALTESRALNSWMMKNDFEPRLGHKFKFESNSLPGRKTIIHCEVVELEEPKCLAYTWQDSVTREESLVIWTLTPIEGGTQLQLRHQPTGSTITAISGKNDQTFGQIGTGLGLFLDEQPVESLNQHVLSKSLLQLSRREKLSFLILEADFKEEWDYRLNHKLPQVLQHYC